MPVNISVTTRRDPRDRNAERKYHATVKSKGRIDTGEIARDISLVSNVSSMDATTVLVTFMNLVSEHLANGQIVALDGFGSFRMSVSSEGAKDPGMSMPTASGMFTSFSTRTNAWWKS